MCMPQNHKSEKSSLVQLRQQAITLNNADSELYCYMLSLGLNEVIL